MQNYNKKLGYQWEDIAANYYKDKWYNLANQNYTIPGWEVDLIFEDKNKLIFIEVKVVDHIDDIQWYISNRKLIALQRTIDNYLSKHETDKEIQLDIVFVKNNTIMEIFEDIYIE